MDCLLGNIFKYSRQRHSEGFLKLTFTARRLNEAMRRKTVTFIFGLTIQLKQRTFTASFP